MNILMFTNTYAPHVGGVARSVALLAGALRERGHRVLVVAPSFEGHEEDAAGVLRFPALQKVAGTDFSLPIPMSRIIRDEIDGFGPQIVHSHHPFLLGDTALRIAAEHGIPIVDTHHTRYDLYVQRFTRADEPMARLMWALSVSYCNLCDAVIAPSGSMAAMLEKNGVHVPLHVIPTGIHVDAFAAGDRRKGRARLDLPHNAFVVGHLGRLAAEKNLGFLAEGIARFLREHPEAHAAIAGTGPMKDEIEARFTAAGVSDRFHATGILTGSDVADFYAALDVFAFASTSETQGIVLAEAMASGCPVVALDAPGAREAVEDGVTGILLESSASPENLVAALDRIALMESAARARMSEAAQRHAAEFSVDGMADKVAALYECLAGARSGSKPRNSAEWQRAWRRVAREGSILKKLIFALGDAMLADSNAG